MTLNSGDFISTPFFRWLDNSCEKGQSRFTLLYKARSTKVQKEELYIHKGFELTE